MLDTDMGVDSVAWCFGSVHRLLQIVDSQPFQSALLWTSSINWEHVWLAVPRKLHHNPPVPQRSRSLNKDNRSQLSSSITEPESNGYYSGKYWPYKLGEDAALLPRLERRTIARRNRPGEKVFELTPHRAGSLQIAEVVPLDNIRALRYARPPHPLPRMGAPHDFHHHPCITNFQILHTTSYFSHPICLNPPILTKISWLRPLQPL